MEKQYLAEQIGKTDNTKTALDPQLRRIQELELQLKEAKEDNEILEKVNSSMNIQRVCSLFIVPLSSYLKALDAHISNPNTYLIILRMQALDAEHIHCLGRRRMHKELLKEGFIIGIFKVARLMKDGGINAKIPKKPHYYPACNEKPNIPNLLKRKFNPVTINTHWVSDMTYIRNYKGWSYLATVLDLHTREIVGYALSKTPDAELAKKSFNECNFIYQARYQKS